MKKRNILALLAVLLAALVLLSACGGEEKKTATKEDPAGLGGKVSIVCQTGTSSLKVLKKMSSDYTIKKYKKIGDLRDAIKEGKYDAAILSAGTAAEMYGKTKGKLLEVSPVCLDGVYAVANGYSPKGFRPSYLVNKRITCINKNSTADQVMQKVLTETGSGISSVKVKYVNSYEAAEKAFAQWNAIVVCTEPAASKLDKISEVNKVLDFSKYYSQYGYGQIPSDVLIVSKKMAKDRSDDVKIMMDEYESALEDVRSKAHLVFYNNSDRGLLLLREYNKTMGNEMKYFEKY